MVRLNKYIAMSGICSRRKADELIKEKRVSVNDKIVTELGMQIDEIKDMIKVDHKQIIMKDDKIYIMLNKPKGYVTTNQEQFGRPSTKELIHEKVRVFPIGRLDMYTEGLLLLTNDGEFANQMMHPKNKIKKVYVVTFKGSVSEEQIQELRKGVDIGDYITKPAEVILLSKNQLQIIIHEGKNRQIRRMCEVVKIELISLKRIQIGNLKLGNLKLGSYKILKKQEIKNI